MHIDALRVGWRRAMDMNDRALRQITSALGGRANGYPRESGFDITAASEVMAIMAVARDLQDLRRRLGAITVACSRSTAARRSPPRTSAPRARWPCCSRTRSSPT